MDPWACRVSHDNEPLDGVFCHATTVGDHPAVHLIAVFVDEEGVTGDARVFGMCEKKIDRRAHRTRCVVFIAGVKSYDLAASDFDAVIYRIDFTTIRF